MVFRCKPITYEWEIADGVVQRWRWLSLSYEWVFVKPRKISDEALRKILFDATEGDEKEVAALTMRAFMGDSFVFVPDKELERQFKYSD